MNEVFRLGWTVLFTMSKSKSARENLATDGVQKPVQDASDVCSKCSFKERLTSHISVEQQKAMHGLFIVLFLVSVLCSVNVNARLLFSKTARY